MTAWLHDLASLEKGLTSAASMPCTQEGYQQLLHT